MRIGRVIRRKSVFGQQFEPLSPRPEVRRPTARRTNTFLGIQYRCSQVDFWTGARGLVQYRLAVADNTNTQVACGTQVQVVKLIIWV